MLRGRKGHDDEKSHNVVVMIASRELSKRSFVRARE